MRRSRNSSGWFAFGLLLAVVGLVVYPLREGTPEEVVEGRQLDAPDTQPDPNVTQNSDTLDPPSFPLGRIKVNEKLTYQIWWNGIKAGMTILRVLERRPHLHPDGPMVWRIRMDTRSNRLLSNFYPVKDKALSIMDVHSGRSRFFSMQKREGDYHFMERIRFDYRIGAFTATYEKPRPDGKWRYYDPIPLDGKVLDPLCALYYLRGDVDLNAQGVVVPICTDRKVWQTKIKKVAREQLWIPELAEKQWCAIVVPECAFNGLFQRRSQMKIWLHEQTRVPVKMEVETPIGFCVVKLHAHENSPLTSKNHSAQVAASSEAK